MHTNFKEYRCIVCEEFTENKDNFCNDCRQVVYKRYVLELQEIDTQEEQTKDADILTITSILDKDKK